jgi:chromosome partitioning protein
LSVLIVDSDPQGSARDWHAAAENNPLPLIALDRAKNIKTLFSVGASYDYVIIDGAAKLEDMIAAGIKAADFVLIPVQPSPYDIWAASDLVEFIKARQEVTDGTPKTSFVITLSNAIRGKGLFSAAACQSLALPCGSLSTIRTDKPRSCKALARLVLRVVLPLPPLGL